MPDTTPPEPDSELTAPTALDGRHSRGSRSFLRIALEVALIALGVLLALLVDQWRERVAHHELARATLTRIHAEFVSNRAAVAGVRAYHDSSLARIQAFLRADEQAQQRLDNPFQGTSPAFLEYTAWDLAIATESLGYLDPDLAQAISHVYAVQRQLDDATRDITQVMYHRAGERDLRPFLGSMAVYFGDCGIIEPRLLGLYDGILPRLESAGAIVARAAAAAPR